MMPVGGNAVRADQVATLRQIANEILTSHETGALLDQAPAGADRLDDWQAANLRSSRPWWPPRRAPPPMPR